MTKKTYSIFPIQQDPACLLKWGWSNIFFNSGTTASCHRTKKYKIDPDNFDQFHNIKEKIVARESMLNGEWPGHGCEYCRDIEEQGGESDRTLHLNAMTDPTLAPPELLINPNETSVTPTQIEVYFNNTCNMKCVYCGPAYSSLWEEENRKFQSSFGIDSKDPYDHKTSQFNPFYDQMVANFWKYLDTNQRYRSLRRLNIAGGEPFLLKELDQCFDFWTDHPNPDLTISIISNLNIPHKIFSKYIEHARQLINTGKIMTLQIIASMDSWGPEQEYVRYGIDLDLWEKNFESIVSDPIITCCINSALSSLTIKQFPLLLEKINRWNSIRSPLAIDEHNRYINHSFNYTTTKFDNPFNFPSNVFEEDFKKILSLMPTDGQIQRNQKKAMEGIAIAHSKCKGNIEKIDQFKNYLTTLDFRRNTNWRATFPWLNTDFSV